VDGQSQLGTDPDEIERLAAAALAAEEIELGEPDRIEALADVELLMDALEVYSPTVRSELRSDPDRALRVLRHAAELRTELTSPAGYAIARFRSGFDPAEPHAWHERPPAPLTIEELEAGLAFAREYRAPAPAIESIEQELQERRRSTAAA
jgi:hypothetical protein